MYFLGNQLGDLSLKVSHQFKKKKKKKSLEKKSLEKEKFIYRNFYR